MNETGVVQKKQEKRKQGSRCHQSRGVILVALVVMMVICAISFSVALFAAGNVLNTIRTEKTSEKMHMIQSAVSGNPLLSCNDAGGSFGNFSRTDGGWPWGFPAANANVVAELYTDTSANDLAMFFDAYGGDGLADGEDGFGEDMAFITNAGTFTLRSFGLDRAVGGGDDIERDFDESSWEQNTVDVRIHDAMISECMSQAVINSLTISVSTYIEDQTPLVPGAGTDGIANCRYDGRTIFDQNNVAPVIGVPGRGAGDDIAVGSWEAGDQVFRFNNVPTGYYELKIQAATDNTYFDPPWADSLGVATNNLITSIFVYPSPRTQRFNVVYPVIANVRFCVEDGSDDHFDQTISSGGVEPDNDDAFDEGPLFPNDYHAVGRGDPTADWGGAGFERRMRAVIRFQIAAMFPTFNGSKVSFARLRLYKHHLTLAPSTPWGWDGRPVGSGKVCVYRYLNNNGWEDTTPTDIDWSDVQSFGPDYSEFQDFQIYNAANTLGFPFLEFNVTSLVQRWAGGEQNNGFLIRYVRVDAADPNNHALPHETNDELNGQWWSFKSGEAALGGFPPEDKRPTLFIGFYR